MLSNRLAFGTLALACVAAAAGGGYLATRQATISTEAAAPTATERAVATVDSRGDNLAPTTPSAPPSAVAGQEPSPAGTEVPRAAVDPSSRPASQARRSTAPARTRSDRPAARATERPSPAMADATAAPVEPPASTVLADGRQTLPGPSAAEPLAPGAALPQGGVAPATPPPASQPSFEELVVAADSVIGLQLEHGLTSDRARVEQPVEARVVRDVRVGRQVAIPAGSRALGSVMLVERGGRFKERARLGIAFHTLELADGSRLPMSTETLYRYGDAPGDRSAKKIGGGAVAGAILGAIIGGAKGAAVGATAGAGGGTAMVMAGERSEAEFPSGAEVTARILSPVTVTVER